MPNEFAQKLISTLDSLSETVKEALPLLEKFDYAAEAAKIDEENLPYNLLPRPLKDICNDIIRHCSPVFARDDNFTSSELLDSKNMQVLLKIVERPGGQDIARNFSNIEIEPIKAVSDIFKEYGMTRHSYLLDNTYNFALAIRRAYAANPFGIAAGKLPEIVVTFTIPPAEATPEYIEESEKYKTFCKIFAAGKYDSRNKRNLYNSFKKLIEEQTEEKPHLVILATILLLRKGRSYNNTLSGKFHTNRKDVFSALGIPVSKGNCYGEDAFKPEAKHSLLKYKPKAAEILKNI